MSNLLERTNFYGQTILHGGSISHGCKLKKVLNLNSIFTLFLLLPLTLGWFLIILSYCLLLVTYFLLLLSLLPLILRQQCILIIFISDFFDHGYPYPRSVVFFLFLYYEFPCQIDPWCKTVTRAKLTFGQNFLHAILSLLTNLSSCKIHLVQIFSWFSFVSLCNFVFMQF